MRTLVITTIIMNVLAVCAFAQTTSFTYQGRLLVSGVATSANYDFEFRLFDAETDGTQLGTTQQLIGVSVESGIFTVTLDFDGQFTGANRWLEIAVRQSGTAGEFQQLLPRQPISSSPYAIRSLNAANADTAENATTASNSIHLGGVAASQFVQISDPRMTDSRDPLPGSSNYIQNNASRQSGADFNISGSGTAGVLNATMHFEIDGQRILSSPDPNAGNLFVGRDAGLSTTGLANSFFGSRAGFFNTTGFSNSYFGSGAGLASTTAFDNSFFGRASGALNTTGSGNSFFGSSAGFNNTTGTFNSFFGLHAGSGNTTGGHNSFFGTNAGTLNTTGFFNSFFGKDAGLSNTTGLNNSFFGRDSGRENTTGNNNAFLGSGAGSVNTTGFRNTILGAGANVGSDDLQFATAVGAGAFVNSNNTLVLGRDADTVQIPGALNLAGVFSAGTINATTQFNLNGNRVFSVSSTNLFVGTNAGAGNSTGASNSFVGTNAGSSNTTGSEHTFFGTNAGLRNTAVCCNSFFGAFSGAENTTGEMNSFFGVRAGRVNTTGGGNSFFGWNAGGNNTTGGGNSFFGISAGPNNTTGQNNTFIGNGAGISNTTGSNNTFIGQGSGNLNIATQVNNSIAIGGRVSASNRIVIGGATHATQFPGKVTLGGGPLLSSFGSDGDILAQSFGTFGPGLFAGFVANQLFVDDLNTIQASSIHLCFRSVSFGDGFGSQGLARCTSSFSSEKDKTDILPFTAGLDVIRHLNPVAFKHRETGMPGAGLNTEDVAAIDPSLVQSEDGQSHEEVDRDRLIALFINAFKQQQSQIEAQQKQIEALMRIVCASSPTADPCTERQRPK